MSRFVPDVQKTSVANRNPSQLLTMLVTQMDKVELRGATVLKIALPLRRSGGIGEGCYGHDTVSLSYTCYPARLLVPRHPPGNPWVYSSLLSGNRKSHAASGRS